MHKQDQKHTACASENKNIHKGVSRSEEGVGAALALFSLSLAALAKGTLHAQARIKTCIRGCHALKGGGGAALTLFSLSLAALAKARRMRKKHRKYRKQTATESENKHIHK
jgi:uncharacterized membrane protein YidH (DUF202 family)